MIACIVPDNQNTNNQRQTRDAQCSLALTVLRLLLAALLTSGLLPGTSVLSKQRCQAAGRAEKSAQALVKSSQTLVIAHRGNSSQAPENTLAAFREAVNVGANLVELDYYHCADGIPVVVHDRNLQRTTNAVRALGIKDPLVDKQTLAQLERLDAGSWFDKKFARERIPTLEQALRVIQRGSTTLIERKGGDAKTCVTLLRRMNLLDQVVIQAFDWDYLADCHRLAPQAVLGALGNKQLSKQRIRAIQATGAQFIGWKHEDLARDDIAQAHRAGLKVWVYTVNRRARAQQLIEWGVDGIITDAPAIIQPLVKTKLPPAKNM
ncbi:MAG: glycerophosphodiester phosphodiesterase family protein [Planctomycetota bacterium]|nr:glycerophosphodiester phosphodiesterase family protein [Planctomycetota bacterium]